METFFYYFSIFGTILFLVLILFDEKSPFFPILSFLTPSKILKKINILTRNINFFPLYHFFLSPICHFSDIKITINCEKECKIFFLFLDYEKINLNYNLFVIGKLLENNSYSNYWNYLNTFIIENVIYIYNPNEIIIEKMVFDIEHFDDYRYIKPFSSQDIVKWKKNENE